MLDPGQDEASEDERILQAARDLCQQLNLEYVSPSSLSWQEMYSRRRGSHDRQGNPIGPGVTPHYPVLFKGSLFLNPVLQDRLGVDEWRPLLVSSIIFYGRFKKGLDRKTNLPALLVLGLFAVFLVIVFSQNLIFNAATLLFTILGIFLAGTISGLFYTMRQRQKLMLLADKSASEFAGSGTLLSVLRKIKALKESDIQADPMASWTWLEQGYAPRLEKRIQRLESAGG